MEQAPPITQTNTAHERIPPKRLLARLHLWINIPQNYTYNVHFRQEKFGKFHPGELLLAPERGLRLLALLAQTCGLAAAVESRDRRCCPSLTGFPPKLAPHAARRST